MLRAQNNTRQPQENPNPAGRRSSSDVGICEPAGLRGFDLPEGQKPTLSPLDLGARWASWLLSEDLPLPVLLGGPKSCDVVNMGFTSPCPLSPHHQELSHTFRKPQVSSARSEPCDMLLGSPPSALGTKSASSQVQAWRQRNSKKPTCAKCMCD